MEHLHIEELLEFSPQKRIRKKLLGSRRIVTELLCYEPGQSTPIHHHPEQDEVFLVLEGQGTISVGEEEAAEEAAIGPRSLLHVPAGTRHGMKAAGDSRMVVLFFKAPATPGAG
jgi:quercetin dioxygenase-like cupin family protein